jgi:oligoendopeptidase F
MSATMTAVPPRAEVPIEETWALESIFATDDAWEGAFTGSDDRFRAVEAFRGRIAEGPATLLAALRAADQLTEAV